MSLNRFKPCDPEHSNYFEYCCFKSNKVFCQACWYKETHPYRCYSSQCGHFEKLAYLVIDRTLEMKVMHCSSEMSPSFEVYDNFHRSFFRIKEAITQKIKSDIESKLPLFLWTSMCEMLMSKNPKLNGLSFEESTCSEMLKIIKKKDEKKDENKLQSLEETVKSLDKVNHLYKGLQNKIKTQEFSGNFQKEVIEIVDFWTQEANQFVFNLTTSLKKHMEMEIGKLLQNFDSSIQFDGIKFTNKKSFDSIEHYNITSLSAMLFPDNFLGEGGSLYHGIKLDIPKLEECPEVLLEISKSMLKERIFQIHSNIREMKSLYPYKYAYVMATTLKPDPEYELAMINLEKMNIKSYEKKSEHTFLNSINLIIMGPELIIVEFKNYPVKKTEVTIYGKIESREKHYTDIIENQLGITKDKSEKTSARNITKIPFDSKLSDTELVYVQFELAYEHLFTNIEEKYAYFRDGSEFEGERSALARGIKEFQDIAHGWNENASINFNIERDVAELTRLFI